MQNCTRTGFNRRIRKASARMLRDGARSFDQCMARFSHYCNQHGNRHATACRIEEADQKRERAQWIADCSR